MASEIYGLVIPKYGMVMQEGLISTWHVEAGAQINKGDELVDIETEKVNNAYESPHSGILRRKLVPEGQAAPIGALFGVIASANVPDAEIDAFIEEFRSNFLGSLQGSGGPTAEIIELTAGPMRFLKTGSGTGTPIVLVHGFGGDLSSWLLNQDALADSHTVYSLDLPGHGESQKNQQTASIGELAATVEAFLDATNLASVHLVGHSLGGGVAAALAVGSPHRVASLTLLAPVGLGREINSDFIQGLLNADRRKEMKGVLETLFHDPALVSGDMVKNVLQGKRIDGAIESLRSIAERCFGEGRQATILREDLAKLRLPVQIVWGVSDRIIPPEHAASLPGAIPVHMIENAGHMVHMEKAAEVNRLIARFVGAGDSPA